MILVQIPGNDFRLVIASLKALAKIHERHIGEAIHISGVRPEFVPIIPNYATIIDFFDPRTAYTQRYNLCENAQITYNQLDTTNIPLQNLVLMAGGLYEAEVDYQIRPEYGDWKAFAAIPGKKVDMDQLSRALHGGTAGDGEGFISPELSSEMGDKILIFAKGDGDTPFINGLGKLLQDKLMDNCILVDPSGLSPTEFLDYIKGSYHVISCGDTVGTYLALVCGRTVASFTQSNALKNLTRQFLIYKNWTKLSVKGTNSLDELANYILTITPQRVCAEQPQAKQDDISEYELDMLLDEAEPATKPLWSRRGHRE